MDWSPVRGVLAEIASEWPQLKLKFSLMAS